jgi:glycyl-tRNA synthetase beta chain
MRKLGGMISDELLISKDQVELSASICKVDLISDLVGEFPELQGIMGGYFAESQGFDKEIALAVSEHYLPTGLDSKTPKKPFSIALAMTDKIDTLVGFFGINQKPTSSKDPYALRRSALGIVKLSIDNNKEFKIKDLISYSTSLHKDQGFEFLNEVLKQELTDFLMDRLKYYMKEKKIRPDITEASINSYGIDHMNKIYKKALALNNLIHTEMGKDVITSYKRAANIIDSELKNSDLELSNTTDPGIFKNDYEKNLLKKINELKKYFTNINKDENYVESLTNLADAKKVILDFFDNVKVNDEDKNIKKNRLELLQMLCRTFDNYINFSNIETK